MDLRTATIDDLRRVEHLMNNRPKRVLNRSTPAALFAHSWDRDQQLL